MRCLLLSGHGIKMNVDSAKLVIQDGRNSVEEEPAKYTLRPKITDYDNLVVYGHSGYITFEAMRWLTKQNIQLTLLNWNGKLLTNVLSLESKQTKLKFAQYRAYESPLRIEIARNLIDAKIQRSKAVLDWLKERYPDVNSDVSKEYRKLPSTKTISEIMLIEARIGEIYWRELSKIFNDKFEFISRQQGKSSRPMGAVDPINTLLNYGYALLESECRKAINSIGLDTHVGFMHEMALGKEPLVYDLQEPFRFLVDLAIITSLEKKVFTKSDFIRTENYNLKLRPSGVKKLLKEIELQFNKPIEYQGSKCHWSYLIFLKARELAHYLLSKKSIIDFSSPHVELERKDSSELRQKILNLSYSQARNLGIGKGALHYLKKNARSEKPFKVYNKIKSKIMNE